MAIDITRLLNRDLSEDLWRRYYKGERGLFTRKLIDQRDLDKIRGKYQENGEFRDFTRSEEHTSELQSLMRISYAVFCLKKKKKMRKTKQVTCNITENTIRET